MTEAGDCFHSAADALTKYSTTLTWAQQEAARAVAQWNAGQDATRQATAQHQQAEQQAGTSLPFDDPGEAGRKAARDILDNARHQLDALPTPTRSKLAGWVEVADERFRGYTTDDPTGRMGVVAEVDPAGRGWWWRRVPDSGPIVEDLARYA